MDSYIAVELRVYILQQQVSVLGVKQCKSAGESDKLKYSINDTEPDNDTTVKFS